VKSGISIRKDRLKQVLAAVKMLPGKDVLVGVPEEKNRRQGDPATNATLAYLHDNGVPEMNLPARPFLHPGIKSALPQIKKYMAAAGKAALEGAPQRIERNLHAAGIAATSAVKRYITSGPLAPLAPSTLAARRRRGRTGTKPLIDTGQLRQSITYVVRSK
jgi:hypothetical protein